MNNTIEKIRKYFNSTSQYPLMMVVPSEEYKETLVEFSSTPKIKVSDYCIGADKEPDTSKLLNDVITKSGNHLLIGLGDYLAANKNSVAKRILSHYKDMVLQPNSHVAILLSAHMYPVVKEIADNDLRVKNRVSLPKIEPEIPLVDDTALVYGIKAYLEACEKGANVGNVKTGLKIAGPTVINPDSAFDELKHKYPNEFGKLSQTEGSAENWSKLLEHLNKIKKNVLQYLATHNFASPEYIFLQLTKKNDYKSWLFFLHLKLQTNYHSYLGYVASKAASQTDLLEVAKTAILEFAVTDDNFSSFYDQRKVILNGVSDADMASFAPKTYQRGADRIAYLTDNTKVEKQAIIVSICEGARLDRLSVSYPDLYAYMQDYQFDDKRFTTYFSAYKKCKVHNKIDDDFANVVHKYAVSRPYNSLPTRASFFSGLEKEKAVLIWLDALGVEFLGYIMHTCAELKLRFANKVARANLPTITTINRDFYDEWQESKEAPIKDIDELKHHPERGYDFNNSPFPIHLSEELEAVRAALERAATKLATGEYRKVIIASDHGASRLAVISPDVQIESNGCEAKSSGRFCQGQGLPVAENIASESEYAVVADYSRFLGSRAASVEVHGGATLEEVLVPIIELTLADSNIQITLESNIIEFSYKKAPELVLIITPDCDTVNVSVNGTVYKVEKLERSRYKIEFPDLKKGNYTLDVFENQNKIAGKEFTIKSKGFAERDIF
ncbi:hypothetical protein FACS1894206_07910 [Deltaproteobacteria bacterium]|nr:hypothetical protein FACS1894206_07910 [Deltaproteobacteria bacterium]